MIIDQIRNAELYYGLNPRMKLAFVYLQQTDFSGLAPGKYEVDGDEIYAMVQTYDTIPEDQGCWEAHGRYIDIQYIVRGEEKMGVAYQGDMRVVQPYNEAKDVAFFQGQGDLIKVKERHFAVFHPDDVHMPKIQVSGPEAVVKVVMKVHI